MQNTIAQLAELSAERRSIVFGQFPAEFKKDIMAEVNAFADEWEARHSTNTTSVYGSKNGRDFSLQIEWTDEKRED